MISSENYDSQTTVGQGGERSAWQDMAEVEARKDVGLCRIIRQQKHGHATTTTNTGVACAAKTGRKCSCKDGDDVTGPIAPERVPPSRLSSRSVPEAPPSRQNHSNLHKASGTLGEDFNIVAQVAIPRHVHFYKLTGCGTRI